MYITLEGHGSCCRDFSAFLLPRCWLHALPVRGLPEFILSDVPEYRFRCLQQPKWFNMQASKGYTKYILSFSPSLQNVSLTLSLLLHHGVSQ